MSYTFHLLRNRNGFIEKKRVYVSLFHFVTFCYVTSIFQIFWSVSSCFRVFPIYLIRFICYETDMGLKKMMYVSLFHSISPCFVTSLNKSFGLLHPVSEIFLYILFVSFVTKQKLVYKKKNLYVSSFHFVSLCFVTSIF